MIAEISRKGAHGSPEEQLAPPRWGLERADYRCADQRPAFERAGINLDRRPEDHPGVERFADPRSKLPATIAN